MELNNSQVYTVETKLSLDTTAPSDKMKARMLQIKEKQQKRKQSLREKKLLKKQKILAKRADKKIAMEKKMANKRPIAGAKAIKAARVVRGAVMPKKQLIRALDAQVVQSDQGNKKNWISAVVNQRIDIPITLKNNGTQAWPENVKIVLCAVKTKSDQAGLNAPQETAINSLQKGQEGVLTMQLTPSVAGRYLLVFRLVSDSGKKFGQCIRLLFNVSLPVTQLELQQVPKIILNIPQPQAQQPAVVVPPAMEVVVEASAPAQVQAPAPVQTVGSDVAKADLQDKRKGKIVKKEKKVFNSEWNTQLDTLTQMGYKAKGLNMKLLQKFNGSIEEVIRVLNEKRQQRLTNLKNKKH